MRYLATLVIAGLIMTIWQYPAVAIAENFGLGGVVVTIAGLMAIGYVMERNGY